MSMILGSHVRTAPAGEIRNTGHKKWLTIKPEEEKAGVPGQPASVVLKNSNLVANKSQ